MIADELRQAGAVIVDRGGRPVAAHYGSVGAELSICRKHVGIAERSDLDVFELTGDVDELPPALARLLGRPAPPFGRACLIGGAWWGMIDPGRAIVVGPSAACRTAARASGLRRIDRTAAWNVFTLLGPRAPALLASTGLPADLVAHGVRACWAGGGPAVLLHEQARRYLLVVPAARAGAAWHELAAAGQPLELGCVGVDALSRLDAAASRFLREEQLP